MENGASLIIGAMLLLVGVACYGPAGHHLAQLQTILPVHSAALWMALVALAVMRGCFLCWRAARRLNSSLLIANAWHARSDAASSPGGGPGDYR